MPVADLPVVVEAVNGDSYGGLAIPALQDNTELVGEVSFAGTVRTVDGYPWAGQRYTYDAVCHLTYYL